MTPPKRQEPEAKRQEPETKRQKGKASAQPHKPVAKRQKEPEEKRQQGKQQKGRKKPPTTPPRSPSSSPDSIPVTPATLEDQSTSPSNVDYGDSKSDHSPSTSLESTDFVSGSYWTKDELLAGHASRPRQNGINFMPSYKGLKIADSRKYDRVQFEGDSLSVINMVLEVLWRFSTYSCNVDRCSTFTPHGLFNMCIVKEMEWMTVLPLIEELPHFTGTRFPQHFFFLL